jgi:hypothetical protein
MHLVGRAAKFPSHAALTDHEKAAGCGVVNRSVSLASGNNKRGKQRTTDDVRMRLTPVLPGPGVLLIFSKLHHAVA